MAAVSSIRNNETTPNPNDAKVDMKLEVVIIPVSDVDRTKEFYSRLGWRLDADFTTGNDWRCVQFTPSGSACSVIFGKNVTTATPGSLQGLYLAVSDLESARKELLGRGIEVSEVFHGSNVHAGSDEPYLFGRLRSSGPDPAHTSYFSFASFHDPDGNGWVLQEITTRLAGRGVSNFDVATMTELLRETEEHHGKYEPTAPKHQVRLVRRLYRRATEWQDARRGRPGGQAPHRGRTSCMRRFAELIIGRAGDARPWRRGSRRLSLTVAVDDNPPWRSMNLAGNFSLK